MKTSRKTIFDLERRCNLEEEFESIQTDLKRSTFKSRLIKTTTLNGLLENAITLWPYRQGATSIGAYASSHGFLALDEADDQKRLFYLELYINLLYFAPSYERRHAGLYDVTWIDSSTVEMECTRCIENIEFLLEQLNMRVREIDATPIPQYVISKRDAQVDAVLEAVPELSEALLSYLDIRNQNDEAAKKTALKAIADYLEDRHKSKYYRGTMYASLEDNLFTVFNKVGIRHGDKNQWKLRKPARMKLYDQTFKAAIHLLQMEDVKDFNDIVSDLKKKQAELVGANGNNSK